MIIVTISSDIWLYWEDTLKIKHHHMVVLTKVLTVHSEGWGSAAANFFTAPNTANGFL